MEKVGFIGACDKTNLIMYVAKALVSMDKKVLVIDTSIDQKTRYMVPSINPTKSYIVEFEKIDFAVGFENLQEIRRYLGLKDDNIPYEYLLIDIDSGESIEKFEMEDASKNYFVTTFEMYSLKRGMDILSNLKEPLSLTRVLYVYDIIKEDEDYLDYISMDLKILWNDLTIYLPRTEENNQILEDNQRVYKLRIKKLSPDYQDGIIFITQDILKEKSEGKIRKSIKE